MKTNELTGAPLALWVAKIAHPELCSFVASDGCWVVHEYDGDPEYSPDSLHYHEKFAPHEDWAQGGPIIEREKISVEYGYGGDQPWRAEIGFESNLTDGVKVEGPTPLTASMRAYVASVYGAEVPDEVAPSNPASPGAGS